MDCVDVSADFQMTRSDLEKVARQVVKMWQIAATSVLLLGAGVSSAVTGQGMNAVFPIAVGVLLPLLVWQGRRRVVKSNAHVIVEPWSIRLTRDGYELKTGVSDARVQWSSLADVRSRGGFWLLRHRTRVVSFIPQAPFGEGDRAVIDAFLAERFPAGKRRRGR